YERVGDADTPLARTRGVAAGRSDETERLAAGGGSPPIHAEHARRACSAGTGGTSAAPRHPACPGAVKNTASVGPIQQTSRCRSGQVLDRHGLDSVRQRKAEDARIEVQLRFQ